MTEGGTDRAVLPKPFSPRRLCQVPPPRKFLNLKSALRGARCGGAVRIYAYDRHERRTIMTRFGKILAIGAVAAVPLAATTIPTQPASAQVYVAPTYSYAYPYPYYDPYYYYPGYAYGYPYYYGAPYVGVGLGWGGWYGGWGHGWHGGGHLRGGVNQINLTIVNHTSVCVLYSHQARHLEGFMSRFLKLFTVLALAAASL